MNEPPTEPLPEPLPETYRATVRTLLRYACALAIVALLAGVSFQESAKKLPLGDVDAGLHLQATLGLALVHGHVFVSAVLLPVVLAGALVLARRVGGRELSRTPQRWLTRGYLPLISVSLGLMLYKGYHTLLHVRGGATDLAEVNEQLFGGNVPLRHAVYGLTHAGWAISLGVFVVALFRSLGGRAGAAGTSDA